MPTTWFATGALLAAAAVALGAFGAHGLKSRVTPELLAVFETGVRYHLYHALALLAVAWAASRWGGPWITWAGCLFIFGVVVFSGSLYVLSISNVRGWGAVTPIGGVALMAGWLCLAVGVWRGTASN